MLGWMLRVGCEVGRIICDEAERAEQGGSLDKVRSRSQPRPLANLETPDVCTQIMQVYKRVLCTQWKTYDNDER